MPIKMKYSLTQIPFHSLPGVLIFCMHLMSLPVYAETYSWIDDDGSSHFTDDASSVPRKYRNKVVTRDDATTYAPQPAIKTPSENKLKQQPHARKTDPSPDVPVVQDSKPDNGIFGGRKPEEWRADFRARESVYKQYEMQLNDIAVLSKKPGGISRERIFNLPAEFRETQKKYTEALKRYNELNEEANKAGLPTEFRK